jgi:primosomal protein N'
VPEGVLFLRRRRSGYHRDIEQWEEILRKGHAPAVPVTAIVGIHGDGAGEPQAPQAESQAPSAPTEGSWQSLEQDLLLPLPSNQEQREIARRLARHHGVVVQGPPGTGKTHAVANLLCHLLAHGKTVLVTAQTDRALRVLRAKVPKSIRSLCVSVLASDVDAQEELRESV